MQPADIKEFIESAVNLPLIQVGSAVEIFVQKSTDHFDLRSWTRLLDHLDAFLSVQANRNDIKKSPTTDAPLDPPFPTEEIISVLKALYLLIKGASNRKIFASVAELTSLLASQDSDVVLAVLDVIGAVFFGGAGDKKQDELIQRITTMAKMSTDNLSLYDLAQGNASAAEPWIFISFTTTAPAHASDDVNAPMSHLLDMRQHTDSSLLDIRTKINSLGKPFHDQFAELHAIRQARVALSASSLQMVSSLSPAAPTSAEIALLSGSSFSAASSRLNPVQKELCIVLNARYMLPYLILFISRRSDSGLHSVYKQKEIAQVVSILEDDENIPDKIQTSILKNLRASV